MTSKTNTRVTVLAGGIAGVLIWLLEGLTNLRPPTEAVVGITALITVVLGYILHEDALKSGSRKSRPIEQPKR